MKFFVRISLLAACVVLGSPAIARAQLLEPLRFTTTFPFEVGHQLLPAGTYVLAPLNDDAGSGMFTLSSTRRVVTLVRAEALGPARNPKVASKVVFEFDESLGHYVMCQAWDAQDGDQLNGTYALTRQARAHEGVPEPRDK